MLNKNTSPILSTQIYSISHPRKSGFSLLTYLGCNALIVKMPDPSSLTSTPTDQTVKEGDETTLHCAASGNPTPNITWIKDGKTVGSGDTLKFQATRNRSGKYWCLADNGLGFTVNASAHLNVQCKFEIIFFDLNESGMMLSTVMGMTVMTFMKKTTLWCRWCFWRRR